MDYEEALTLIDGTKTKSRQWRKKTFWEREKTGRQGGSNEKMNISN